MTVAWWAIVVSVCSLIVAGTSLAWNVLSFRRSGPLISATLEVELTQEVFPDTENFMAWQVVMLSNDRFSCSKLVALLTVTNSGRAAIDITRIFIDVSAPKNQKSALVKDVNSYVKEELRNRPEAERRLEAGSSRVFEFDISSWTTTYTSINKYFSHHQAWIDTLDMRATVSLGNGIDVKSQKVPYRNFVKKLDYLAEIKSTIERRGVARLDENER